nr:MAG: ORF1 [Torque teno midi virus]
MAFYWNRRKRWWWGPRRRRYKRKIYRNKRRKRRRPYRRSYRRPYKSRRRRRTKVRRKKQKLNVVQWQPDTIRKCKIKGEIVHVLGGQGKQFRCFTDNRFRWTEPTAPGGGGFGAEKYTLQFLFNEYVRGNNIWTTSNKHLDLCRYTGCKFKVYRHPHLDFLFSYSRMYPMQIDKYSYSQIQPFKLLQRKHRRIIPSMLTQPHGKRYKIIKIKPPKQLTNKWFFQQSFSDQGLVEVQTTVCDLRYSHLGCCNNNRLISFKVLNLDEYQNAGWGNSTTATHGYKPRNSQPSGQITVKIGNRTVQIQVKDDTWLDSINYNTGWFQTNWLQATEIISQTHKQLNLPIKSCRYNPVTDTGDGNKIYFLSVVNTKWDPPQTDKDLILEGLPLWQLMLGFADWVIKTKKDQTYLQTYYMVVISRFIEPGHTLSNRYVLLDDSFILGRGPYDGPLNSYFEKNWYPAFPHQQKTINAFVTSGPYMPKLDNQKLSTWELKSNYYFYFKWGGSELPAPELESPEEQARYDVPSDLQQAIQIADPSQVKAYQTLHSWDFRRGFLTTSALKRIQEDSGTDDSLSTDGIAAPPKKKKKEVNNTIPTKNAQEEEIHQSLLSLYEEDTSQEQTDQSLQQLILKQQQQQKHIKLNLLRIISNLQQKQMMLQLQTGMFP